ncbi:MAG: hypothetical protein CVU39_12320 [Chloroflexi bacterium HGW-Chloroflexi-10]|nr:MAG: hypothetical protein CVU39_12320 [Chloroflexi bacterium HGW-Chloroflexi-10]
MKTLQIIGNSAFGGATRLVLDWCKYLVDKGCLVDVLTTDQRTKEEFSLISGVQVRQEIFIPRDIEILQNIQAIGKLIKLLKEEKYQVVHTYSATPGFVGRLSGFLSGIPVVLHHQAAWAVSDASSFLRKYLYQLLESIAIGVSTKNICVSNAVRKQANDLPLIPKSKLVTICNGIDVERFNHELSSNYRIELCNQFGITQNSILLGNTGRLAVQKDYATLIQAVEELKNKDPERSYKLFVIGDGPDRDSLESLANSLNLSNDVFFLGFRSDISKILKSIDVFVSPTLREGLSISILEAMAAGCPIVATNILPNAELIEHEVTGLLIPIKSPIKAAEAILSLVEHPDTAFKIGQAARNRVLQDYTCKRMFDETFQLYCDLLSKKDKMNFNTELEHN